MRNDVQLELDAIEAIFPDENQIDRQLETCKLVLRPNEDASHVQATLEISFPEAYPDVPCEFTLTSTLEKHLEQELHQALADTATSAVGGQQVYILAEQVLEYLQNHDQPTQSAYDMMMNDKKPVELVEPDEEGEEVTEDVEFEGLADKQLPAESERITEEQFQTWRVEFRKEMEATGVWKTKELSDRLTGRQLFERDASLAKQGVTIDEELYQEEFDDNFELDDD